MAIIDVIKYDAPSDQAIVWKYSKDNITLGTQLIVNESQEAVFVKGGHALDVFGPGTHTLSSGNLPFLQRIVNIPFGGKTPFSAEVWYVNKHVKRDMGWGTPTPLQVMDPTLRFPVTVRAYGKWGFRIADSRSFLTQIVGTLNYADSDRIEAYFIGEITQQLRASLGTCLSEKKVSFFDINAKINELARITFDAIRAEFARFGIEVINFNIQSVNIPDAEMERIQKAHDEMLRANAIGSSNMDAYRTMRTFDTLDKAASNEGGAAGAMMAGGLGLGLGIGAGIPAGQQLGGMMNPQAHPQPPAQPPAPPAAAEDPMAKLQKLKQWLEQGLITQADFDAKKNDILKSL
jgi:membrane protease subunit (stomatin/prohibitin family)